MCDGMVFLDVDDWGDSRSLCLCVPWWSGNNSFTLECPKKGPVEYLYPMAPTCPRRNRHEQLTGMFKKHVLAEAGNPSSKAAALLARGAYSQYVSTAKGRERRWRLFSTFPEELTLVVYAT